MMEKTCENKAKNEENCPCKKTTCENHGICCACVANHRSKGNYTSCMAALGK